MAMDVPETLLQYRFHLIVATLFSVFLVFLINYAPSLVTVVSYFWPLFLSTGVFLFSVVFFGRISPSESDTCGGRTGEELMHYVAGQEQHHAEGD
ncbi:hypothetical protein AAC387_Pa05g1585 [Persea americana]